MVFKRHWAMDKCIVHDRQRWQTKMRFIYDRKRSSSLSVIPPGQVDDADRPLNCRLKRSLQLADSVRDISSFVSFARIMFADWRVKSPYRWRLTGRSRAKIADRHDVARPITVMMDGSSARQCGGSPCHARYHRAFIARKFPSAAAARDRIWNAASDDVRTVGRTATSNVIAGPRRMWVTAPRRLPLTRKATPPTSAANLTLTPNSSSNGNRNPES